MLRRRLNGLVVFLIPAAVLLSPRPVRAQEGVLAVKSIDALKADIRYVLTLVEQKELADQLDAVITLSTQGKGLQGVDSQRPLGIYGGVSKDQEPQGFVFVPISDERAFLKLLEQMKCKVGEASMDEDRIRSLELPSEQELALRCVNQYAYVASKPGLLKGKLPAPAALIPASHKDSLIAGNVRFDALSKEFKQLFIQGMEAGMEKDKERRANESETEYQGRLVGMKLAKEMFVSILEEGRELTLGLDINQQRNKLGLDLALAARPGTKMATSFRDLQKSPSMFGRLGRNPVMGAVARLPVNESMQALISKAVDDMIAELPKKEKDPKKRAEAETVVRWLEPTLKADTFDVAFVVNDPGKDGKLVLVGAMKVKDGKKFDKMFRDMLKEKPADEKERVELDHARAEGVAIHRITPSKEDRDPDSPFGDPTVFLASREDAILMTVGANGLSAMKDVLADLDKAPPANLAPVQAEFALARLAQLGKGDIFKKRDAENFAKVFSGADKDKDKIRLTLTGGDSLRLLLEMDAQILKLGPQLDNR